MMQVISNDGFIADAWDGADLPDLEAYHGGPLLVLTPDDDLNAVIPHMSTLALIVVPFPGFADGRGFSLAARLREAGYRGHLRARGHVLVDQLRGALRCGFDTVEVSPEQSARNPEHQWRAVGFDQSYQARLFAG